ncbi:jg21169 [Pararge aegeria aegeria]|uniref:Jg21169 protein n=1 Tax=Pararge aegeria aegeria TaxID=348720 RepID=A0A8S4SI45_9NEOP|nr:jg21169 [Pararge aegeria aegeria]
MEAGRAFQILAVRLRNEDAKRLVRVYENQSAREARNREVTARTKPSGRRCAGREGCRKRVLRAPAGAASAFASSRLISQRQARRLRLSPPLILKRYSHRHALMLHDATDRLKSLTFNNIIAVASCGVVVRGAEPRLAGSAARGASEARERAHSRSERCFGTNKQKKTRSERAAL